jgi:23S rRNA (cytosine1962-C5)-methyltransferase
MIQPAPHLSLVTTAGFGDYALLDSGAGRKLERFGDIVVDRPEAQALWRRRLSQAQWANAHAVFSASAEDEEKGRWRVDRTVPESWPVRLEVPNALGGEPTRATMLCRLAGLWHLGLFPEQLPHWQWMLGELAAAAGTGQRPRVLNLFAYTGAASLLAAAAGAEVTHVDASKKAIAWAKDNQRASGLDAAPIRWILDDAGKFVAREVRRGRSYHLILVDPPKFGRGPDGEVWELFDSLPRLLDDCARLLAPGGAAVVLTVYAIRASALAFGQLVAERFGADGAVIETGELAIREEGGARTVPSSLFTRWTTLPRHG